MVFTSNKVFFFCQINLFIASYLCFIWARTFDFLSKRFDFLFRKRRCSLTKIVFLNKKGGPEFSIFLKSLCLLLAIFVKFIFDQKGKRGNFPFFISKTFAFLFRKKSCSLKIVAFEFQKHKKNFQF